jgi:hypothetical protein
MGIQNLFRLLDSRGDAEAMNSQTLSEESLKNGRRWTFAEVLTLAADGSEEIVIDNSLADDTLRLVAVDIDPDDQLSGTVDANVTVDSAGTDFPVQNDRVDGDVAATPSGVSVEYGGTYSGGEASLPFRNTGGVGGGAARTDLNAIPTSLSRIQAGFSKRYTITDESSGEQDVTVTMTVARTSPV